MLTDCVRAVGHPSSTRVFGNGAFIRRRWFREDFLVFAVQSGQETEPRRHNGRKMIPLSRYQFIRRFMSRFLLHVQERESRINKSIQESTQYLPIFTWSGRPGGR